MNLLGLTDADANPVSLASAAGQLPLKLAIYSNSAVSSNPEILIVGDSIVRYLTLPGAITYCLSGVSTGSRFNRTHSNAH